MDLSKMNPADVAPVTEDRAPAQTVDLSQLSPYDVNHVAKDESELKFSSPGQQALTVAEGLGKGLVGPGAPLAEKALTELGVGGLSPEEQEGRAQTNPGEHGISEAAGFTLPTVASFGASAGVRAGIEGAPLLGNAISGIGEAALKASGLGGEGASALSKMAASGIKTYAEMAALQASDEASKAINQDPGQTLGTAAINIGLAGLLGGAGGAILGSVSPLFKSAGNKLGLSKLIDDAKGQYEFRTANVDPATKAFDEITSRMKEVDEMHSQLSDIKGEALEKAMPEVTPENTAKIDQQLQDVSSRITQEIEKAADNPYLRGGVPKLSYNFQNFLTAVTDPNVSYVQKFSALDTLKRDMQGLANYSLSAEDSAMSKLAKSLSHDLRAGLEDSKVWGDAGEVQAKVNSALSEKIGAHKDLLKKFTTQVGNERIVDPAKLQSYLSQAGKGKAGIKTNVVKNYLDSTQELADTIAKLHDEAGLDAPVAASLNPTPVLDHSLDKVSSGAKLADWWYDKGAAHMAGDTAGGAVGAGIGAVVGHPGWGALAGEKILGPAFTAIAKPILEKATNSEAARASLDYLVSALKGEATLVQATRNFFKPGAELFSNHLLPAAASREKLQKSLDHASEPSNMMNVAGNLGHYLPNHASTAAAIATTAVQYLNNLKPKQPTANPMDAEPPIDKSAQAKYNRALDIAQQPLMVLQHAKNGTLLPQDILTLKTIYPSLHSKLVNQLGADLVQAKSEGHAIPYKQRIGLSQIMGVPLDSTMTQSSMQAILNSVVAKPTPGSQSSGPAKPTNAAMKATEKTNALYATPLQARAIGRGRQ